LKRLIAALLLALSTALPAAAQVMPVGPASMPAGNLPIRTECLQPPTTFNNVWYFDATNGSPPNYDASWHMITSPMTVTAKTGAYIATKNPTTGAWSSVLTYFGTGQPGGTIIPTAGLGTQAAPWNDVSAVMWPNANVKGGWKYPLLTTVPTYQYVTGKGYVYANLGVNGGVQQSGPIKPGDEILLLNGNYGTVSFNLPSIEVVNSGFVTVAAAPGQTPVIASMVLADTNNWHFDGIKFQSMAGVLASVNDGGGAADQFGNPLVTSNIVFTHEDFSNADDSVANGWTQVQWRSATSGFQSQGSNDGANTTCVSVVASHAHNLHEGITVNSNLSTSSYNEVNRFTDNALSHDGSYQVFDFNFTHDPVDVGLAYHVDGSQQEGFALLQGQTWITYTDIEKNNNLFIDRYDPTSPFATICMTGMDDYSGVGYVIVNNLRIQNNVFISCGTAILYELNIQNSNISNNTVVPISTAQNPLPGISLTLTNNSNSRVCNNLAPNIVVANNQPGVTFDNNIAVQYAAYIQNADGTWPASASFLQAYGWWGTTGHYSATQTSTNNNQAMSIASFMALFNQDPTGVPPTYDVTLKPGSTTNGSPSCGPQTNALGAQRAYWVNLNAAQATAAADAAIAAGDVAAAAAAQATYSADAATAATDDAATAAAQALSDAADALAASDLTISTTATATATTATAASTAATAAATAAASAPSAPGAF